MIWYNIQKLEGRLIHKTLHDRDGFNYLLAYFVVATILTYLGDNGYNHDSSRWIDASLDLIVTIIGIKMTWKTNSNGDRADYFIRFISLSFVNAVRVALKLILTIMLLYIMINLLFTDTFLTGARQDIIEIAIGTIFQLIFFYRLNQSFKNVSVIEETFAIKH
jgi:hypothetical protein